MSLVPTTVTLPDSFRRLPVCYNDANSAAAAALTQLSPAKPVSFSPESCTLSCMTLWSQLAWSTGSRTRSAACPAVLSTVERICEGDVNKRDVFQPLPNSRLRVCPASPGTSWGPDPNPSLLHQCQTLPEPSFCLFPGLSASRAERRGEEKVEWLMFFKPERGYIFLVESVHTYPRKDCKLERNRTQLT